MIDRVRVLAGKLAAFAKSSVKPLKIVPDFAKEERFQIWAIVIGMSLLVSLLLVPRIHFSHPQYQVGFIAVDDVKADRDFLVEEKASTEQKRMEAIRGVQSIYDYDSEFVPSLRENLTKVFASSAEMIGRASHQIPSTEIRTVNEKTILSQIMQEFRKTLGIALSNEEIHILAKYRFSREIAEKILRSLQTIYETELISNVAIPEQDRNRGIIVRNVKTRIEEKQYDLSSIRRIEDLESSLQRRVNAVFREDRPDIKGVALSLVRKLIQPNLTFNRMATERHRQILLEGVKPVFSLVQKNEMIVREGQKITRTDLDKLEAYYRIRGESGFSGTLAFVGMFLTIIFLCAVLYYPLRISFKQRERSADLLFLAVTLVLQIFLVRTGVFVSEALSRAFSFFPVEASYFAIPFTTGAMLVAVLTNRSAAMIFSIVSSLLVAFIFDAGITMAFFSFLGCATISYHLTHCHQRSAFFRAGLYLGAINACAIFFLDLLAGHVLSLDVVIKMVMGITGGILASVIVVASVAVFETLFGYTTDIRLLELANLNHPIFQRMIMEAPGTYHHSIIVASLVEAAAEAIGANSLLAKVSAYYHDIGKMKKPQYFIENQRNGENRHDKLSPKMSGLVIISHIKDGCELAKQFKLGSEIGDIIRQHHGTSIVSYFYEKAKKDKDASIRSLPESDFRYPGPKPQTREAGLVLLGDVIEASSRTLTNPTPSRIRNLVRERIERVFMDGQLDNCELTLRDLNSIAESFIRILNGIFHQRIDYPEPIVKEFNGRRFESHDHIDQKQAEKGKDRSRTASF
ncbi:MAG: HDIG domain-containing protein [Deltaproteobacteria bacterium]|nr:HDIG domain-containing protein [Deltaproteobacteria bacterium]